MGLKFILWNTRTNHVARRTVMPKNIEQSEAGIYRHTAVKNGCCKKNTFCRTGKRRVPASKGVGHCNFLLIVAARSPQAFAGC